MLDCIQEHQALITTIGLALNVAGSIIFIIDTNRLSNQLAYMVRFMSEHYGLMSQHPFEKEPVEKLDRTVKHSKKLTRTGYFLFLMGFAMQLIPRLFL